MSPAQRRWNLRHRRGQRIDLNRGAQSAGAAAAGVSRPVQLSTSLVFSCCERIFPEYHFFTWFMAAFHLHVIGNKRIWEEKPSAWKIS